MEESGEDSIDKSVWCAPEEIRQYRQYLIDQCRVVINGDSMHVAASSQLPLDRLTMRREHGGEEILTEAQREAGLEYKIICDCIQGRYYANGQLTNASSQSNASAVIKKIAIDDQLTLADLRIVERIAVKYDIRPITNAEYKDFHSYAGLIQNAFESLGKAMQYDNLQKALDRRRNYARIHG